MRLRAAGLRLCTDALCNADGLRQRHRMAVQNFLEHVHLEHRAVPCIRHGAAGQHADGVFRLPMHANDAFVLLLLCVRHWRGQNHNVSVELFHSGAQHLGKICVIRAHNGRNAFQLGLTLLTNVDQLACIRQCVRHDSSDRGKQNFSLHRVLSVPAPSAAQQNCIQFLTRHE